MASTTAQHDAVQDAPLALDEPDEGREVSPLDCLREIRLVADELDKEGGTGPTTREFQEHPETSISLSVITDYFGGWPDAVVMAGYAPVYQRDVPEETLCEALQVATVEKGEMLTRDDIREMTPFSLNTYLRTFDDIETARAAAGVDKLGVAIMNGELDPERVMEVAGDVSVDP